MKKIFFSCSLLALLIGVTSSCQTDNFESKFDENATERTNMRIQEFEKELIDSEEGWKMTYFTDDSQLGGFTFLLDFEDSNYVRMISDFDGYNGFNYDWAKNPLVSRTSGYDVTSGSSTISLVFSESTNYIHLLANNSIFPNRDLEGKGYMGVFQFLYYGIDSDGINLRTNRHGIDIRLERATAEDWDNLKLNRTMMDLVSTKRTLITFENGESMTYDFRYTKATRYATVLNADRTMSVNVNGGIGVGFTPTSIKVSPAIEFEDGSSISELILDGNRFVGEVGDNQVFIL